jgi:hypothetical protein
MRAPEAGERWCGSMLKYTSNLKVCRVVGDPPGLRAGVVIWLVSIHTQHSTVVAIFRLDDVCTTTLLTKAVITITRNAQIANMLHSVLYGDGWECHNRENATRVVMCLQRWFPDGNGYRCAISYGFVGISLRK